MNIKSFVTILALGTLPLVGSAMPTKAELDKVSPVVQDLMKPEQDALKAGKKTKGEVAAAALELVAQADGEAAKLLLTKGAYNLYVREGDFDKAVETLKSFRETVPDMEPEYLANIIESSLRTISRKNGGQLYRLLDETKAYARCQNELKLNLAKSKKDPGNAALHLKIAEEHAVLGNWSKALEEFAKGNDRKAADIAKAERGDNADFTRKAIADFWWEYPTRKSEEFQKAFKQHAAAIYEEAIGSGDISGLTKVQAERRIEEAKEFGEPNVAADSSTDMKDAMYCIIDLSAGPNAKHYPVSYKNEMPRGGWTDEYKTKKLVMKRIKAGADPLKRYSISKDFYAGVFEVTQKQWELVMGNNPAKFKGDKRPIESTSFADVRGKSEDGKSTIVEDCFIKRIRDRTGITTLDLPTEAQWEYACRAGSTKKFVLGDTERDLNEFSWWKGNAGDSAREVGTRKPNDWGLYDLIGNVWERCIDDTKNLKGIDPMSPVNEGADHISRGGCYGFDKDLEGYTPVVRIARKIGHKYSNFGFRLFDFPKRSKFGN